MEILEVQGVIRHLVEGVAGEFFSPGFEFQHEDDGAYDEQDVDPLAHSRDRELEVDASRIGAQGPLKDLDFLNPGVTLGWFDRKVASPGELPDDLVD